MPSASPFDLGATPGQALPGGFDLGRAVDTAGGQSLDKLFGLGGGTSTDPMASFLNKTAPGTPQEAAAGTPISTDPLSLIKPRAHVEAKADAPAQAAEPLRSALADDVPELNAAMPLPQALVKAAAPLQQTPAPMPPQRDVLQASFSFMPPPKPAGAPHDAPPDGASPFADLGLGTPAKSGLLDDLDLSPQTVPAIHLTAASTGLREPSAQADLPVDVSAPAATEAPSPGAQAAATQVSSAPLAATSGAGPADAAGNAALWAAFCEGAGIQFTPPQGLNPELMRVIGQLLKHTVDGSLKLVAARAATKQEMRAEVTVIQARRNNPLKFSPDAQSALEQLLQPPLRGFMTGPEAVSDAMDDLLGHTIGTMVGMRAALEGVLGRFEPAQLESKLVGHSMLDSLLPMNRRAKLWELYLQHFEGVRAEAQDDFHNLFGRAFLQAYEEQLDRLEAERRQPHRAANKPA
jgi:FHA domain-containing protein